MTGAVSVAVVDTNVWLDNYLGARPGSKTSRSFIVKARSSGLQLAYPIHALPDIFYLLQANVKKKAREEGAFTEGDALAIRELAWACIENMREFAVAVGADESDAWRACKYRHLGNDLEDNMVMAAAERAKARFIVTNDRELIRKATVAAYTPEDALAYLKATAPDCLCD